MSDSRRGATAPEQGLEDFVVAWDREETEPCQVNTPGCSVEHVASPNHDGCETW